MALWFIFALMTAAAVFAVLWPLGQKHLGAGGGTDAAVYKDQLAEVERDLAAGLIGATEAAAARLEISRRLLAAAGQEEAGRAKSSLTIRRFVTIVALLGLPLMATTLYLRLGNPALPGVPLAERMAAPRGSDSLDKLVGQVKAHLEKNPTDGRGWEVIAPVLQRLGRIDEAVVAFRNALTYNGDSAARRANLGEAVTLAANGVVTQAAKAEFEQALAQDPKEPKARYFLGLAAEQDGRPNDAAAIWRAMIADAPADAPWRPLVEAALARVGGTVGPSLSNDAMTAADNMSVEDRGAMIRGMVERLATRLQANGNDVEGWLRLIQAYMVLGEPDKAAAARDSARQAVAQEADHLRKLNDGLKALGLDG